MENCTEIILNEITHIELIPTSLCTMPIPFRVAELTAMQNCVIGTPTMVIDVNESGADGILQSAPTLKTTEKPQAAGYIRDHTLQASIFAGYEEIRAKKALLSGTDFYVVLRTLAGTEFLLYTLPASSQITVDDQIDSESKQTVKISLQSASSMIRITRKTN